METSKPLSNGDNSKINRTKSVKRLHVSDTSESDCSPMSVSVSKIKIRNVLKDLSLTYEDRKKLETIMAKHDFQRKSKPKLSEKIKSKRQKSEKSPEKASNSSQIIVEKTKMGEIDTITSLPTSTKTAHNVGNPPKATSLEDEGKLQTNNTVSMQSTSIITADHDRMETNTEDNDEMQEIYSEFATVNRFSPLNDIKDQSQPNNEINRNGNSQEQVKNKEKVSAQTRRKGQNHQAKNFKTSAAKTKFKSKHPPIIVYNATSKEINNVLHAKIENYKFIIKNLAPSKCAVYVSDFDTFKITIDVFKVNDLNFHTKTPKEEKIFSRLLKGIANDYDADDILDEINELKLENVNIVKIIKIDIKQFFKVDKGGTAFLVQVSSDSMISNLTNVDRLANQEVWWETLNKKEGTQCFNCQRIGHVAKYCNRGFRCVKCPEIHAKGECKVSGTVNRDEIYCVLCKSKGHPASYKGCPKIKERKEMLREKINHIKNKRIDGLRKIQNFVNPNVSFANVISNQTVDQIPSNQGVAEQSGVMTALNMEKLENVFEIFKKDIMSFISVQLQDIRNQVNQNTLNIGELLSVLTTDDDK